MMRILLGRQTEGLYKNDMEFGFRVGRMDLYLRYRGATLRQYKPYLKVFTGSMDYHGSDGHKELFAFGRA